MMVKFAAGEPKGVHTSTTPKRIDYAKPRERFGGRTFRR